MHDLGIHILCIQETHIAGADSYVTTGGSLVTLSGGILGEREYAGVGFLISPTARPYMKSFSKHSDRLATLRTHITGGQLGIISAHALSAGDDFPIRQSFFHELGDLCSKLKCHGPKLVF